MTMMIHTTRYTAPHKKCRTNNQKLQKNASKLLIPMIAILKKIKAMWEYEKDKVI